MRQPSGATQDVFNADSISKDLNVQLFKQMGGQEYIGANIPIDGVSVWMALDSDSLDHPNLNFQIDQRFQAQLFGRDLVVNFNAHNFQFDAHGKLLTTNPPVAAGDGANTDANPASGNLRLDIDAVYQLTSVFRIGIADTNAHESSNDTSCCSSWIRIDYSHGLDLDKIHLNFY